MAQGPAHSITPKTRRCRNGESLVAVAAGILEGARLESLLQHDRLGLDKETEYLEEAAKDGGFSRFDDSRNPRARCRRRRVMER